MTVTSSKNPGETLYDQDFFQWLETTAQQIKNREIDNLDWENLLEEIEAMGRSEKRELKSRLIVLLMHLLKWKYQPEKRSESWLSTISEQRISLENLLEESPSLKPFLPEIFDNCYQKSRQKAANETGLPLNIFPTESPFSFEDILNLGYLPD